MLHRDQSPFSKNEVFIPKGESLEGFMPVLKNNNTGEKLPEGFQAGDCHTDHRRAEVVALGTISAQLELEGSARQKLFQLQAACGELAPMNFPLQHVFAPGAYARTIFLPAGSVIVGKIHKHKHLNILSQGTVYVMTEAGGTEELQGPLTMVSEPGTKRAVFAVTDTVWTTIHLTNSTDLATIESEVIARDYAEYEEFIKSQEGVTL